MVSETFAGTAHSLCGDSGLTVAAATAAPQAEVRRLALEQLDELLGSASLPEESRAHLQSCALAALADDNLGVVSSALALRALQPQEAEGIGCPAAALLPALQALLLRLSAMLLVRGKCDETPAAITAAKLALALLARLAVHEAASPSGSSAGDNTPARRSRQPAYWRPPRG